MSVKGDQVREYEVFSSLDSGDSKEEPSLSHSLAPSPTRSVPLEDLYVHTYVIERVRSGDPMNVGVRRGFLWIRSSGSPREKNSRERTN